MTGEAAWIVRAEWLDGQPTFYGPFQRAINAEVWALALRRSPRCVRYDIEVLDVPALAVAP